MSIDCALRSLRPSFCHFMWCESGTCQFTQFELHWSAQVLTRPVLPSLIGLSFQSQGSCLGRQGKVPYGTSRLVEAVSERSPWKKRPELRRSKTSERVWISGPEETSVHCFYPESISPGVPGLCLRFGMSSSLQCVSRSTVKSLQ